MGQEISRKYIGLTVGMNIFLLLLLCMDLFGIKAHFDDNAFLWKLIWAESGSWTHSYHYFNDMFLLQYGMQGLYKVLPTVPWFTLFCLGTNFLSIAFVVNVLMLYAVKKGNTLWFAALVGGMALFFLNSNLLWVHHNRVAFLMASSALLGQLAGEQFSFGKRPWYRIGVIGWFLVGALVRPESALASLALGGIAALVVYGFQFRVLFKALWPYASIVVFLFGYYVYQINYSTRYYYQLEPDGEHEIIDRKNVVPISDMKTPADSAKYKAATSFMLADVKEVNPTFIRSLIKKENDGWDRYFFYLNDSPHRGTFFNMEKVKKLWLRLDDIFCLFAFCLAFLLLEKKYNASLRTLLYFFFALIVFISLFSMNEFRRVVEPLSGVTVFWLLFVFCSFASNKATGKIRILMYVLLFMAFGAFGCKSLLQAWEESVLTAKTEKEMDAQVRKTLAQSSRKYVVWASYLYAPSDIYNTSLEYGDKQPLYMEFAQFSGNEHFLATVAKVTGCPGDDFACRLQFLKDNRSDMLIFGTTPKLTLYNEYARKVYGMDIGLDTSAMRPVYGRLHALEMP